MYICAKCMCYAVCPLITVHAFTCPVRVEQNDISRTFRLCLGKTVVSIPLLTISVAGAQIRHATTPTFPYAPKRETSTSPTCLRIRCITPDIFRSLSSAQPTLSLSLRLSHSLRAQQFSFESRVHWTWPYLSRVRQRSLSEKFSAGLSENLLDICLGHAATHSTTSHAQACLPKYYLQRRVAPHHTPGTCQTECVR